MARWSSIFLINKNQDGTLNYLKATKSDSLSFVVECVNPIDNQQYQFVTGDKITLYIKRFYTDQSALVKIDGTPIIGTGVATFSIGGADTLQLNYGGYICQIVLLKANGEKHTIVNPCLDKNGHEINNFFICQSLSDSIQGLPPTVHVNSKNILQSTNGMIKGVLNYPSEVSISLGGTKDHTQLTNLAYPAGHTGFQPQTDTNLKTTDKTTTGAINELFDELNPKFPKEITGGTPYSIKSKMKDIDGGTYNTVYLKANMIDGGNVIK